MNAYGDLMQKGVQFNFLQSKENFSVILMSSDCPSSIQSEANRLLFRQSLRISTHRKCLLWAKVFSFAFRIPSLIFPSGNLF